jgi:hypothetical protein
MVVIQDIGLVDGHLVVLDLVVDHQEVEVVVLVVVVGN